VNTVNGATVKLACETLEVARSGFYNWQQRDLSKRDCDDIALLPRIEAIHRKSKETYGSPRITAELRAEGEIVNEKRVARLMRENDITAQQTKRFKVQTTDSNHDLPIADRIFKTEDANTVMAPDQVYVGDITYIWTDEGFLFLAIFMDIFTRKIVGHKASDHMRAELVLDALSMALGRQDVERDRLIAHSDRGSQYASEKLRERLELCGIIASMSRKGNCWDNAHCESFFHTLKAELVFRTKFKTREEAKAAIFEWIECWYNAERRHSALGYMAPNEYEKLAKAA
jgi:transposase InsO family protein